ncbi:DUF3899 domain-containing protein [Salinicoccus halodurans]|uniref:DUF3899 domain-containing protein n=1 Tax=Salinicoccus halodurans TaxID=407035 RepID=A0A0F7HN41_9STAP|nr:DUF3899 domain-containing protein [Salinicoccus halodurans]AKG74959.1 hypothetical protein AAT16_12635 [Salinicoccus halodurans]SFK67771.1 protein of unknown function [Salinicoccus halodurans]
MTVANRSIFFVSFSMAMMVFIFLSFDLQIPVMFLDIIFMAGLVLFIAGGFIWMIGRGVYDRIFKSFRDILKHNSKLEIFVEENEVRAPNVASDKKNRSLALYILVIGMLLVIFSTILSAF